MFFMNHHNFLAPLSTLLLSFIITYSTQMRDMGHEDEEEDDDNNNTNNNDDDDDDSCGNHVPQQQ